MKKYKITKVYKRRENQNSVVHCVVNFGDNKTIEIPAEYFDKIHEGKNLHIHELRDGMPFAISFGNQMHFIYDTKYDNVDSLEHNLKTLWHDKSFDKVRFRIDLARALFFHGFSPSFNVAFDLWMYQNISNDR